MDKLSKHSEDKKCRNCGILISERSNYSGRAFVNCRSCIENYKLETRRTCQRAYYHRHKQRLLVRMREYSRAYHLEHGEYVRAAMRKRAAIKRKYATC